MLATQTPHSVFRKRSIFRRFSRREKEETPTPNVCLNSIYSDARPGPRKLRRHISEAPGRNPNPPVPVRHHTTTDFRTYKPQTPQVIIQRIDIAPKSQTSCTLSRFNSSVELPRRILPSAIRTTPFSGTPFIRPWDMFLTPSQIFSLYLGYEPQDMSDKWFIYSEGPDRSGRLKVHFHRSWTGMKIAQLFVVMDVKGEGAGKIVGIKWNGSKETNGMNEEEAKYMVRMICLWTLGVDLEQESSFAA